MTDEPTPEDIAEMVIEMSEEKSLPVVVLGGDAPIASALLGFGGRFLHTRCLHHLVAAIFIVATNDELYSSYKFPPRSVVLDPFGLVADQPSVEVLRFTDE